MISRIMRLELLETSRVPYLRKGGGDKDAILERSSSS